MSFFSLEVVVVVEGTCHKKYPSRVRSSERFIFVSEFYMTFSFLNSFFLRWIRIFGYFSVIFLCFDFLNLINWRRGLAYLVLRLNSWHSIYKLKLKKDTKRVLKKNLKLIQLNKSHPTKKAAYFFTHYFYYSCENFDCYVHPQITQITAKNE